jgi:hypothetical protein
MAEYFQNPNDLRAWVRSRESAQEAAQELMQLIETIPEMSEVPDNEQDIHDSCEAIFEQEDGNASEILFGVLAKYNITKLTKQAKSMKKEALDSRQRNEWKRNRRNKWNRVVDAYNENTPWRIGRDKYYDFTHYATDEVRFDEDPYHIYSGESIWRTYVMDKFYRDYKDKDGKLLGGYINDRFHVFPTAGTPANPDSPRDGGNQMALADGERTRQPRPHQYSIERRMEEARGNKTKSITVSAESFDKIIKVASSTNLEEAMKDRIFNIFKDTIEMREAGIEYETMVDSICDHYNASVMGVAQIDQVAQRLVAKHAGIGYETIVKKAETLQEVLEHAGTSNIKVTDPNGANAILSGDMDQQVYLDPGSTIVNVPNAPNTFEIVDHPINANLVGSRVSFSNMDFEVSATAPIQDVATDLGLNEDDQAAMVEAVQETQNSEPTFGQDFAVTELHPN